MFRSVLASRASDGQGQGSAQGLNRMGGDISMRSGRGEESECPRRGSGRCPVGQAEMGEDSGKNGRYSMEARISARPPESEPAMMSTRPFIS